MSKPEQPFLDAVQADLLSGARRIVVGFSGGPDSTALLLALHQLGLSPSAVHLHHGLRELSADEDAAWCEAFCAARGIPFTMARLNVSATSEPGESVEMAARRCRLAYWREMVANTPGMVIALGHHQDDRLETFLIRLLRGGNTSGLTSLRPRSVVDGVTLIRPMLGIRRAEIEAFLEAQGVEARHDPTNDGDQFLRNRIRHALLPLMHDLGEGDAGLIRSLDCLEDDACFLESLRTDDDWSSLSLAGYRALPAALRPRALRAWLSKQIGDDAPPRQTLIAELERYLERGDASFQIDLSAEHRLVVNDGQFRLEPNNADAEPEPIAVREIWNWKCQPTLTIPELGLELVARYIPDPPADLPFGRDRIYWPASALPRPLLVRLREPGDRFQPFGQERRVRVKKLVSGAKVKATRKPSLVVACPTTGEILWMPWVRRAARDPVTPDSKPLIELSCHAFEIPS